MKNIKLVHRIGLSLGFAALSLSVIVAPAIAFAATLTRELSVGMSGNDVSSLQTFLARDTTIYPSGRVTGYFGPLTKAAVMNFQSRNGIPVVGRVGPMTLAAINTQMTGTPAVGITGAARIYGVATFSSRNTANITWNTDEPTKGTVYYSTTPLTTYENFTSVDVSGTVAATDFNFHLSQNVLLSNLQANTTYYYLIYTTDQTGNVSVTWPSVFNTVN